MASTNTLLRTIKVTQNFLKNAPLTGVGGNPVEPAMTIGDQVRGFILSAPFAWRWNRATTTFSATAGVQDYTKSLPNFGWLEKAATNDGQSTANSIVELENKLNISEDNAQSRPRFIGARLDDDNGTITFRLLPVPDTSYTVTVSYQQAAPSFVTVNDTWAPIPDYMSNIYNWGFRAFAYEYFSDERYGVTLQMFLRHLVSASEGLDSSQKNIYLSEFLNTSREQASVGLKTQLAHQGRAGY